MFKSSEDVNMDDLIEIKNKDKWISLAFKALNACWKCKGGYYFHDPVDPASFGLDDYFDVIKQPMDFGTIKRKLMYNVYGNMEEFINDMNLVFNNCLEYNGAENTVTVFAMKIKSLFESIIKEVSS